MTPSLKKLQQSKKDEARKNGQSKKRAIPLSSLSSLSHLSRLPGKAVRKLSRIMYEYLDRRRDYSCSTWFSGKPPVLNHGIISSGSQISAVLERNPQMKKNCQAIALNVMNHSLEILGSGWAGWGYCDQPPGLHGIRHPSSLEALEFGRNFNSQSFQGFQGCQHKELLCPAHRSHSNHIHNQLMAGEKMRKALLKHSAQPFPETYEPIDWQRDIKTGYRWKESQWFREQPQAHIAGADIKMPWELSRMQHLLRLAICACSISSEESNNSRASRNLMILEFRSQVLDFIAMNPPRMGVNWKCTMDVAIRLANLLAARDIFLSLDKGGTILDSGFTEIFSSSIMDHVLHILSFPEWSANLTSNHYLSNIAGLSVALAYLRPEQTSALNDASRSNESLSNAWWNNACWNNTNSNTQNPDKSVFEHNPFQDRRLIKALKRSRKLPLSDDLWKNCLFLCIQEMCREIHSQFLNDGGNFENSTSYHRLSAEMATFGLAALIGCCRRTSVSDTIRQNLNQAASKLMKTAIFTHCISLDNGTVPLIGDDDSGRFLPFTPIGTILSRKEAGKKYLNLSNQSSHSYETIMPDSDMNPNSSPLSNYHIIPYWDENFADHSALPAAVHGLFAPQSGIESVPASTAADFTLKALEKYSEKCPLEFMIVSSLANGNANPANGNSGIVNCNSDIAEFEMSKYIIPISLNPVPSSNAAENNHLSIPAQTAMDSQTEQKSLPGKNSETTHVPMSHIEPGISWSGWLFPDWGLIKLSNGIHTLYLNNSGFGQRGNCGHSHSDKLSILLFRDCRPLMIDPGTYLYTPLPTVREFFRSSAVHSQGIPAWSIKEILLCEQIKWKNGLPGLFSAQNTVHINPFAIHENSIVMSINSEKSELRRQIIFTCKGLEIVDSIKLLNRSPEQEDTTMKQSRTALKQCCTTMSQNDTTLKFDERNMPQWLIDSLVSENHSMILRKEKTPLEPLFSESYGRVSIHRQNPDFQKTDFQEN